MAARRLSFWLAGMVAVCLALLAAPLDVTQRIWVLTAIAVGVAVSAVVPFHERFAPRIAGLAVLVAALVPPSGVGSNVALVALAVLGAASADRAGMARVVPAVGLPLATLTLRSGAQLDPVLLAGWIVAVVATVLLGTIAWPVAAGRPLGGADRATKPVVFERRLSLFAVLVLAAVVPLSLTIADAIDRATPPFVSAVRAGDALGPRFRAHPGLTGGLDAGTPVELGDEIVLRVKAAEPHYWRGATYADWDGRRWTSGQTPSTLSWSGDGVRLPTPPEATQLPGVELPAPVSVTQRFTAERAGLDVVPGAWRIDTLYAPIDSAEVGDDGSVQLIDSTLGAGATWTVTSRVVPATEADLRLADPLRLNPDAPIRAEFGREDDVSAEVAELTRELAAEAPTTYDKVRAIEAWMNANLTYTRDIGPLPAGVDAVDHLLFESKRGYCEQIGSALVVMLRSQGIPARLVVGYVPSEYESSSGEWLSRASDAHAWAEVYFPGIGWRGFDPTAGVPTAIDDQQAASLSASGPFQRAVASIPLTAVAVFVVLLAVPALVVRARLGATMLAGVKTLLVGGGANEPLAELHRRFQACGDRLGLGWPATMTLRDRARSMVAAGIDPAAVKLAARALEQATFGAGTGNADSGGADRARSAIEELERAVTPTVSGAPGPTGRRTAPTPSRLRRARAPRQTPSRSPVP